MWEYNNLDELYHHGILGMKWGRRKQRYRESKDYRRSKAIQKKSIKSMSNRELDIVNNRLTKEKNYRTNKVDKYLKGAIIVSSAAAVLGNLDKIYKNSGRVIDHGKNIVNYVKKKITKA